MKRSKQKRVISVLLAFVMLFFVISDSSFGVLAANEVPAEQTTVSDAGIEEDTSSVSDADIEEDTSSVSDAGIEEDTSSVSDAGIEEDTSSVSDAGIEEDTSSVSDADVEEDTSSVSDVGVRPFTDSTTENITLAYGQETEGYASYEEALARINELDSATNEYVLTYTKTFSDSGRTHWVYELPAKAGKLTFSFEDKVSDSLIRIMGATADYPIVVEPHVMLESTSLGTLYTTRNIAILANVTMDNLYMMQPGDITVYAPIELQNLTYEATGTQNAEGVIRFTSTETFSGVVYGKLTVGELALNDLSKLNIYGTAKNSNDKVIMEVETYTSDLDKLVLHSEGVAGFELQLTKSESSSSTVSWEDNGEPGKFHLTYGETLEKFLEADDAFSRIIELNNAENEYVITSMEDAGSDEVIHISLSYLPEIAGSLKIIVDSIRIENVSDTVTYPVTLEVESVSIINSTFADLAIIGQTAYFGDKAGATKLTLTNVEELGIADEITFDKVIYQDTKQITFAISQGTGYDWDTNQSFETYGCLRINELTAEDIEEIKLSYYFEDTAERTLLEIGQYTEACDLLKVESFAHHDGRYGVVKQINEDNSYTVSLKEIEAQFTVETSDGETFGAYQSWNDLLLGFKNSGDVTEEYIITAANVAVISTTMPQQAKKITLQGDLNYDSPKVFTTAASVTQPVDMKLKNIYLCTQTGWNLLMWKANGKTLELSADISFAGVNGASNLVITDEFAIIGIMKNIGALTIEEGARLRAYNAVSGVGKVYLNGSFAVTGSKAVVLPDIVAGENATIALEYYEGEVNASNNVHNITLDGNVTGNTIAVKKVLVDNDSNMKEQLFTTGTKLFTAANCTGNQFTLDGDGMICYKKGNVLYAGTETLELLVKDGEEQISLGHYMTLADIKTEIARRKQADAAYIVDVKQDILVAGALPLPTAGTYKNIVFTGEDIFITGAISLTGNTEFQNAIKKVKSATDKTEQPIGISLGKYELTISQGYAIANLGTITGAKGSSLHIGDNVYQEISGAVTNVETLKLEGTLAVWGNLTVTNVEADAEGTLAYDLDKTQTIAGAVKSGKVILMPFKNGNEVIVYTDGMQIIDKAAKIDVQTLAMKQTTNLNIYCDGKALKLGSPVMTVFVEPADNWKTAEIGTNPQFVRFHDAVNYIQNQGDGTYAIRLETSMPSAGKITMPSGVGKTVMIGALHDGDALNFTGGITLDGANIIVDNVQLRNGTASGVAVTLKNAAGLTLRNSTVNNIKAPAGTKVILGDGAVINKTLNGAGALEMEQNATVRIGGAVTVKDFKANDNVEIKIASGKTVTIKGVVTIPTDSYVTINQVDKEGKLAAIKEGATMISSASALAGQFRTDNVMTGTADVRWLLTKSGNQIKTAKVAAYAYPIDDRQTGVDNQFASFNEAKEYVAAQSEDCVIELLGNGTNADLTNLPQNLLKITKGQQVTSESVKLATKKDVYLVNDFEITGVIIEAKGKTLYAAGNHLICSSNAGLTVAKVRALESVTVTNGLVTVTGSRDNQINHVHLGENGSMKCPLYSGFTNE